MNPSPFAVVPHRRLVGPGVGLAGLAGLRGLAVAVASAVVAAPAMATEVPSDASFRLDASPVRFSMDLDAAPVLLGALSLTQDAASSDEPGDDASVADWTMGDASSDDSLTIPRILPVYGEAGSMRLDVRAGYGTDVKDGDQWIAQGGVGLSAFIEDGLAIRAELNGAQIRQVQGSEQGINFVLLVEWHFLQRETWSLYLDAGAGVLFTTDDVPANGSSFNFTPQAGVGLTFDVFDETRAVLGVRWHHISNANTFDENPGRDHVMIYGGLSFPF